MYQIADSNNPTMSSREIAELTGKQHKDVMRDIRVMCEQMEIDSAQFCAQYQDSTGRTLPYFELDRYHTEVLVTGYDVKRRAAVIKRWYDLESGKAQPVAHLTNIPATMALVECAANLLRASDSGRVVMLRKAGQAIGADTSFLPDYTEDSAPGHVGAMDTASATQLLREHGITTSAAAFNERLYQIGLLERRERKSTGKNIKHFWCITNEGLAYGKNIVSPQSPRETQPHWYHSTFGELLALVGLERAA
ncbi:MAG: Rha family transcriptional regulator [Halomonas sp.]|nr:Rha family transcriptional regulator [Halomonas sp.]MBF57710.1 Rha family transcriptional regulator [Halomonas sp.]|tara:strand:- start:34286 stop:35035 length:750 start_codon:yes stop_codon:yes gene_type:complete